MTRPTMDDPFDRRLRGFLDWQAEQLADAPSANEITARLADQAQGRFDARFGGRLGRGPAARLAWAFLVLALLAAMAVAVAIIGSQDHRTSVVLPTPSRTAVAATAVVPTPTTLCPSPAELIPAGNVLGPGTAPTANYLVAYLANDDSEVRIAGGGLAGPQVAATIRPANTTNWSEVLGWSNDGSTILVHLRNFSGPGGPERNCGDLWLLNANGSGSTKFTQNGPGQDANGAVLAGNGVSVAYIETGLPTGSGFELRTVDALRLTTVLAPAPCDGDSDSLITVGPGRLAWSPDGARVALLCLTSVTIYSIADGTSRDFVLPPNSAVGSLEWSADGARLLVTAPNREVDAGSMSVIAIDPQGGAVTVLSRSSVEVQWGQGLGVVNDFSPDGKWLLTTGGAPSATGSDFSYSLYLVDIATGGTRQLFGPSPLAPCCLEWLPDSSGFVRQDPLASNAVVEYGLDGQRTGTLGSLERWGAWHWLIP
jgi:hypothetical protein